MLDTHAHLDFEHFDQDRDFALLRSKRLLRFVINPTVNLESARRTLQLFREEEFVYFCLGFHPHYAQDFSPKVLEVYEGFLEKYPRIVGVGEVGLDFYKSTATLNVQKEVLRNFIEFSLEKNLTLVIHLRDAQQDLREILEDYQFHIPVVMHCFSSPDFLDYALERGFYISFSGNITYPKSENLRDSLKKVPLNRLLLETDSPYLSPLPKRGQRNEPGFIIYTFREVSSILGMDVEKLQEAIFKNALRAFSIDRFV